MTDNISRRNARLAIAASFFGDFAFVLPIWLLYSIHHLHFSPVISVLFFTGVFFLSGLFEIPTGAMADRIGRKKAFVIGKLLFLIFPCAYIFGFPLPLFIACTIIAGFGNSLSSGALAPLVHASYEASGVSKREYHKFFTRSQAALFFARVLSGIGGAWLYTIHPALPFAGWAFSTLCNIVIGISISEQHIADKAVTYRAHIGNAIKHMMRSEVIVAMLAMTVLIGLVTEAIWTGYQAFYEQDSQSPLIIGALFSIIALFGAITVSLIRHTFSRLSPFRLIFIGSLLTALTAYLLYQENVTLRLLAVVPMAIAAGFINTTIQVSIQSIISNKLQSTALSAQNSLSYGVYFIGSLWVGWVIQTWGLDVARSALLVSSLASLLAILFITLRASRNTGFMLEEKL